MKPRPPEHLDEIAQICLRAIAKAGLGHFISVGGAVGLLHFLDHRPTHDVHAWWSPQVGTSERQRLVSVLKEALSPFGEVHQRSWGDVLSIATRLLTFCAYHLVRSWHELPRLPYLGQQLAHIRDDPSLEHV